jgi:quercetin dioxygenase-like cupin family protein
MKNTLAGMAIGIVLGGVVVLLYSSVQPPRVEVLSPLPTPFYTVLFESDHVRVVEHRLDPGDSEPMHSHPPMVVYFMENADVRITGPDGATFEESLTKGLVIEAPALSHSIENLGDTPVHSLLVELKART